jgi:heterodisulfide reductase subunit A
MAVAAGYLAVDHSRCDLCGGCVAVCAPLALSIAGSILEYDADSCTACGDCVMTCPLEALSANE